jgi:hypothetical protein
MVGLAMILSFLVLDLTDLCAFFFEGRGATDVYNPLYASRV